MTGELAGMVSVVTGAANGIGRAVAHALAAAGSQVCLLDKDQSGLDECAASIESLRGGAVIAAVACDLRNQPALADAFARIASVTQHVHVLVNNAGGSNGTPLAFESVTEADYDDVVDLNLKATFFCSQRVLPMMRAAGTGSIVNIASISGRAGIPTISAQYSAAKGGVLGFTRNLATQLGREGIRVNAIAPGYIASGPRVDAIWDSRDQRPILNQIALGRRGTVDDIAQAVVFLAGARSVYISGATLDVNGGYLAI